MLQLLVFLYHHSSDILITNTKNFLNISQKLKGDFELCGVEENKLNSQHWQNVEQRMQTEEAAFALAGGEVAENG